MLVRLVLAPTKEVVIMGAGEVAGSVVEEDREDTKPSNHHRWLLRRVILMMRL